LVSHLGVPHAVDNQQFLLDTLLVTVRMLVDMMTRALADEGHQVRRRLARNILKSFGCAQRVEQAGVIHDTIKDPLGDLHSHMPSQLNHCKPTLRNVAPVVGTKRYERLCDAQQYAQEVAKRWHGGQDPGTHREATVL
jgi:hypothetical protein